MFSQTGSEIYYLSCALNRYPDVIITNKSEQELECINFNLLDKCWNSFIFLNKKPTIEEYNVVLEGVDITTLHGYLRIIPPTICNSYEIYNSHPAPLSKYDFLKGKDPQKRIFEQKLDFGGNTIHKCTAELDSGEIMLEESFSVKGHCLDVIIALTHKKATGLWYNFLKNRL